MFTWIPIYKEIANKLLEYEDKQTELINIINELKDADISVIGIQDIDNDNKKIPLVEIDPFTFFSNLNRSKRNDNFGNKIKIINHLIKIWNLLADPPNDFDGTQIINNQKSWFFAFKKDRQKTDIPMLWKIFKEALNGAITVESFQYVIKTRYGKKITTGLFWICPKKYLGINEKMKELLKKNNIDSNFTDYKMYTNILEEIKTRFP